MEMSKNEIKEGCIMLWRNFLSLESRLVNSFLYVEYDESNYHAYSLAFRGIILESCSDIELAFKLGLYKNFDEKTNIGTIADHFCEGEKYHQFIDIGVSVSHHNNIICPWKKILIDKGVEFWQAYNNIKHHGGLKSASLINAINSLAGLFACLLFTCSLILGKNFSADEKAFRKPVFFDFDGLGSNNLNLMSSHNINVPGVPL